MPLTLIQKDDCQLCDEAWDVLAAAGIADFESVYIDTDEGLLARYGDRVPVLRDDDRQSELDWPFTVEAVRSLIG